jgi:hypothetical protein
MHSRGVSKPVFKVLNAMGITESYDSAMESIEGLRSHAMNAIHGFAKSLRWLIAYDNLDVTVDTHEQTVGSQEATRNPTLSGYFFLPRSFNVLISLIAISVEIQTCVTSLLLYSAGSPPY